MASPVPYGPRAIWMAREEQRVGGVSYDVLKTNGAEIAEAWLRDLPPLNPSPSRRIRVVGVAFSSGNSLDGGWVVRSINLSVSNRVLQLHLRWGALSIPDALRDFLRNSSNLFVGDEVGEASNVFEAVSEGVWMPRRRDLAPLVAWYGFHPNLPRPNHEVLARSMLGWSDEHLSQIIRPSRDDDVVVQSCVVAQHVGRFLVGDGGGAW